MSGDQLANVCNWKKKKCDLYMSEFRNIWRYRKLVESWKEAKPPPKTAEEAARLVIQTLKNHQKADVEVHFRSIAATIYVQLVVWCWFTDAFGVVLSVGIIGFLRSPSSPCSRPTFGWGTDLIASRSTVWVPDTTGNRNNIAYFSYLSS